MPSVGGDSGETLRQSLPDQSVPKLWNSPGRYNVAHWRSEFTQSLRIYSRITQYRESDFDFIVRLLAQENSSWRFEHDQSTVACNDTSHSRHTLVLFDCETQAPDCAQPAIRFHRADASELDDNVQVFNAHRQVQPNASSRSGWDYKTLHATAAQASRGFDKGEVTVME